MPNKRNKLGRKCRSCDTRKKSAKTVSVEPFVARVTTNKNQEQRNVIKNTRILCEECK